MVLAVLVSTIIPPFALRFTISYYNKVLARTVKVAETTELRRAQSMDALNTEMSITTKDDHDGDVAQDDTFLWYGDDLEHPQTIGKRLAEVSEGMAKAIHSKSICLAHTSSQPLGTASGLQKRDCQRLYIIV